MKTLIWRGLWDALHPAWERLDLAQRQAESQLRACDGHGHPFQLDYQLQWDSQCRLRQALLQVETATTRYGVELQGDGQGNWRDGSGQALHALHGCRDIDIWPTPFTNSLPIRRLNLRVGQREAIRVLFIEAPRLALSAQPQAYTRLDAEHYRFEALDGNGFSATLQVDAQGLVLDYPGLFRREP